MKTLLFLLSGLFSTAYSQSLIEVLVKKIPLEKYYAADIGFTDTTWNTDKNYFEIATGSGDTHTPLIQAMAFKNNDATSTLVVTGLFSDEQCSFHKTFCFTTTPGSDSLFQHTILPPFSINDLLAHSKAPAVLKTYLPKVKKNYLDKTATLDDLINEVYELHYHINPQTTKLELDLDVCDYIPVNQVAFKEKDWILVKTGFSKFVLAYDTGKKCFVKAGTK